MLSSRVVDYLLRNAHVSRAQVDDATRMKGFFGGAVESHLLRLGHVEEATLAKALTEITGVPYAWGEHLREIPADARARVPVPVLEKHRMCPFRVVDGRLRVAMLDPRDRTGLAHLQAATGRPTEAWVTSEYRLHQALERHFGIRIPGVRAIAPAHAVEPRIRPARPMPTVSNAPTGPSPPAPPSIAPIPVPSVPEPEGPVLGFDGLPIDAPHDLRADASAVPRDETFDVPDGVPSEIAAGEALDQGGHGNATPESVPWDDAAGVRGTIERPDERIADDALDDVLCAAADRDAIARALLDVASRRAARVGLFAAGRDGVRGVAGRGRGLETDTVTRIELPPEGGTIFDTALRSRDFYFGIVPPLPPNRDLYTALGGRLPRNVLLVPIRVKDRTIAILYLDNDADSMPDPDIGLIRRVAAKAGLAFEMLLLRSKLRSI